MLSDQKGEIKEGFVWTGSGVTFTVWCLTPDIFLTALYQLTSLISGNPSSRLDAVSLLFFFSPN